MIRSLSQTLFDPALQETQDHEIKRVRRNIGGIVMQFCRTVWDGSREFYMSDLELYVSRNDLHSTPGSAGRILRMLRKEGQVDYVILRRSDAHYQLTSIKEGV
jgi:hypothetical protein